MNDQERSKLKAWNEDFLKRVKENNLKYKNLSREGKREMIESISVYYPEKHVEKVKYEQN